MLVFLHFANIFYLFAQIKKILSKVKMLTTTIFISWWVLANDIAIYTLIDKIEAKLMNMKLNNMENGDSAIKIIQQFKQLCRHILMNEQTD